MSPMSGICVISVLDPFKLLLSTAAQNQKLDSGVARNKNIVQHYNILLISHLSSTPYSVHLINVIPTATPDEQCCLRSRLCRVVPMKEVQPNKKVVPKRKVALQKKKKGNTSPNLQSRGHSVNACASKNALQDNLFTVDPTVHDFSYLDDASKDDNLYSADDDSNDDDINYDDSDEDCFVVNLGKGMCVNRVNHCNVTCLSCDFPKNCCRKTRDIALTSTRDYVTFPSSTIHC